MLASYPPRPAAAAEIRPVHRPFRPCSRIRCRIVGPIVLGEGVRKPVLCPRTAQRFKRRAKGVFVRFLSRLRSFALLALIAVSVSACGYNVIPTKQEAAKAAWAEVQNQYQRRADLVPNLVATVQGYAKQEKDVLTQVTEARAKATSIHLDANDLTDPEKVKAMQQAQAQLSGALGRLLAISENYPDLKSNQNFLALQSQLEGTENRIAVARRGGSSSTPLC